jgi:hypothetical protein
MQQTASLLLYFKRGYIAHPYWPAMDKLVNIQKNSGMNRAKSTANRRKALEEYLRGVGMTLADYEKLEVAAKEPFYRDESGEIIIPELHVMSFLVATCSETRAANRPCDPNQVRSRFVVTPWPTGKHNADGDYERFALVTGGSGQKLSNQRGFRSNPFIADFETRGTISFDQDFVDPATLKRALDHGGMFVGIGACRRMGWGRFVVREFVLSVPTPTASTAPTLSPTSPPTPAPPPPPAPSPSAAPSPSPSPTSAKQR